MQYDVFVCKKSADSNLAMEIYDYLDRNKITVFNSEVSLQEIGNSDYRKTIDTVLDLSNHIIIIGSSIENITSHWVEAEWGFFVNEKRAKRKSGNIITVITDNVKPHQLPPALRTNEIIYFNTKNFPKILSYVRNIKQNGSINIKDSPSPYDSSKDLELAKKYYLEWDLEKAFKYFLKVELNEKEALFYLGEFYFWGNTPVNADFKKAKEYYEKAISKNFLWGYHGLANILEANVGSKKKIDKYNRIAYDEYFKAAVEGDFMACYLVAHWTFLKDLNTRLNTRKWLSKSAEAGFVLAKRTLNALNESFYKYRNIHNYNVKLEEYNLIDAPQSLVIANNYFDEFRDPISRKRKQRKFNIIGYTILIIISFVIFKYCSPKEYGKVEQLIKDKINLNIK